MEAQLSEAQAHPHRKASVGRPAGREGSFPDRFSRESSRHLRFRYEEGDWSWNLLVCLQSTAVLNCDAMHQFSSICDGFFFVMIVVVVPTMIKRCRLAPYHGCRAHVQ